MMEQQAKAQRVQGMIDAGEMAPGANLALDTQNEQQVGGGYVVVVLLLLLLLL